MKLSAPIYQLKRRAKNLVRQEAIPLHAALDRVAVGEGYGSWSLLASRYVLMSPAKKLFDRLEAGDLVLIGARPGQGKTLLALDLASEAVKAGHPSVFFTLEYTDQDVMNRLRSMGFEPDQFGGLFELDCSNAICADYIIDRMDQAARCTLIVIDYLQLLDQRRENAELATQVGALRSFAKERGLTIVFLSQIDRSYDPSSKPCPDLLDVRLPNPVDLGLFSKTCFLNDGALQMHTPG